MSQTDQTSSDLGAYWIVYGDSSWQLFDVLPFSTVAWNFVKSGELPKRSCHVEGLDVEERSMQHPNITATKNDGETMNPLRPLSSSY